MPTDPTELVLPDADGWRRWLDRHGDESDGVWLVLAKKGADGPTQLRYQDALEVALCFGWIDGQTGKRDDATYRHRFTPRRARSPWSKRNVGIAERLIADGRMQPRGLAEIERAKADGRWQAAYDGPAKADVPADLRAALDANPAARRTFDQLNSQNRYAVLFRLGQAKRQETRDRRLAVFVDMLARGETIHPQRLER